MKPGVLVSLRKLRHTDEPDGSHRLDVTPLTPAQFRIQMLIYVVLAGGMATFMVVSSLKVMTPKQSVAVAAGALFCAGLPLLIMLAQAPSWIQAKFSIIARRGRIEVRRQGSTVSFDDPVCIWRVPVLVTGDEMAKIRVCAVCVENREGQLVRLLALRTRRDPKSVQHAELLARAASIPLRDWEQRITLRFKMSF